MLEPKQAREKIEFFASQAQAHVTFNNWIKYEDASVYLRKGRRMLNGQSYTTLELASVTRKSRGKKGYKIQEGSTSSGFMSQLMDDIEAAAAARGWAVYIENVINEFLPAWLTWRGYTRITYGYATPSFYLIFPELVMAVGEELEEKEG